MTRSDAARVLWITGAGSGMGRAIAVRAAAAGYRIALSGRRPDALEETRDLVGRVGGHAVVVPLDVGEHAEVTAARDRVVAELGPVTRLVCSAGLNDPRRSWADQSMPTFDSIVRTNLTGAVRAVDAVLPGMRDASDGSIVLVSSHAGWTFSPGAGVAYSASKTALRAVSESINAQENANGIRCCHLCPGDVATDFLHLRPEVPDAAARESMLTPDDVAAAALFVLDSPRHVTVNELVITPTKPRDPPPVE